MADEVACVCGNILVMPAGSVAPVRCSCGRIIEPPAHMQTQTHAVSTPDLLPFTRPSTSELFYLAEEPSGPCPSEEIIPPTQIDLRRASERSNGQGMAA